MANHTHEIDSDGKNEVSDKHLRELRREAGEAGDLSQVALCDRALAGDHAAREECLCVIAEARAQE